MRAASTILSVFLLASSISASAELSRFEEYRDGNEALANHLPAQAVQRYTAVLAKKDLTAKEKEVILLKLCEAQVRSRQGAAAEITLAHAELENHPDKNFWLGQALIAQGNYGERAIAAFKAASEGKGKQRGLALLALSQIYKTLNEDEKAYEVLKKASALSELSNAAYLQLVEGFLEKGELKKAEEILAKIVAQNTRDELSVTFLKARLLLNKKQYSEAYPLFAEALQSEKITPALREACYLGRADALAAQGKKTEAIAQLLELIEQDFESQSLHLMFSRLINWSYPLEENEELRKKLELWVKAPDSVIVKGVENKLEVPYPDRNAFSHYLLAKNLAKEATEASTDRALALLVELRKTHPRHILNNRSLILTAQIYQSLGKMAEAKQTLDQLAKVARTEKTRAQAIFLKGMLEAKQKDDEQARKAFAQIIASAETELSEDAKVNLALLQLRNRSVSAFVDTVGKVKNEPVKLGLLFERAARALAKGEPNGRELLSDFLTTYPKASEATEGKLLLANDLLAFQPLKPERATELIIDVQKTGKLTAKQLSHSNLLLAQVYVLNQEWEKAVELCERLITEKADERLSITLGEAYYRNGEYNKARKVLNQVVIDFPNSAYKEHCYFFAALSAKKETTPQSQEESLELFDQVIALKGNLLLEAYLQKARLLIDREKLAEAMALIEKGLSQKSVGLTAQKHLKILLADTLHRMGGKEKNPEYYARAIKVYNELISSPKLTPVWSNRLYYLKGQTQERVDPTNEAALDSYFKVINLENQQNKLQPVEWEWYYKSGLRAVDLLEKDERWKAAVSLLEKMAGYGGPKSDVLAERARKIRLAEQFY